ncbi:MAG: family 20 glycosylhydrolase [Bacteroidaceae bacterium]|nr:family 20 glycosylhydrolase [Bacteroidaceae bacterium]
MKKLVFGILFLCCGLLSCSDSNNVADYRVVPLPQEITTTAGDAFVLSDQTYIVYPKENAAMERNAEFLAQYIKEKTNLTLTTTADERPNAITLATGNVSDNKEGYKITVKNDGISIVGASEAGVFYGIQTLRKSLPVIKSGKVTLPAVEINDYPRFSYRGAHFDVSRHFFTMDSVKRFIDMLALHNINRFHWHLTDDQGWRIEIKKYPKLSTIAAERDETVIGRNSGEYDGQHYGPFIYTQDDCREIVRYAAERHITVIPEIDLPGHMQAALAAYPEYGCTGGPYEVWKMWGVSDNVLCAGNDATLKFIEDVLSEVIEIFPSEYIHIGGDECPKTQWEKCPKCQARIKKLGIKGDKKHSAEMYLQSFVINHAEKFLNSKGRQIIGWDEILEGGLAPNATVHSWRGVSGGIEAAKQGHDCIMSPTDYMYFDYYQTKYTDDEPLAIGGYLPIEKVYSFEPYDKRLTPEQQKHIIGVQANLWTEYIPTYTHVEYMELPRMAALAEVQWCKPENKDYEEFKLRLMPLIAMYDLYKYNYAKHIFDINPSFVTDTENGAIVATFTTIDNADVHYTLDGTEPTTASPKYTGPVQIKESCTIKVKGFSPRGATRTFSETFTFNKATAKPIEMVQPINEQYIFEGPTTLVDGLRGNNNYRTGRWLGFRANDFEAIIDLKAAGEIKNVSFNTNVEKGDWIFGARGIIVSVSEDGKEYTEVFNELYPAMTEANPNQIYTHSIDFAPVKARYVKVKVLVEHSIPEWHGGRGNYGFLFVDEIAIN